MPAAEMTPPDPVRAAFEAAPASARPGLRTLRALILSVAAETPGAEPLTETLRWGQPAYLAPKGTALRLGTHRAASFALFAHCQSRVIPAFRDGPGAGFRLDGTRAVLFDRVDEIRPGPLSSLIRHALTYRLWPGGAQSRGAIYNAAGRS
ncbi:DUF1801 domain-containing protein [Frigidibacter sp. ROC022]|uniref:DUF1801 domain-containing protein n=1 Tax=Frigidibacter sp. ROC022 TaxID=2971796 RepID=UPI00215AADB3|nr:DUF1801 domain-containing protein [Frigidibacter sp. ROC022]MCR8724893.1 DUF1801 domain-containing protein [Frigidibacter sp. ROC022]